MEKSSSFEQSEHGVYTLANDAVIEWFQAFIRSFRRTNPNLPLTVIPYDENISRLRSLREEFHFEIMDSTKCRHYNVLADKVKVSQAGCFRKFASFFGPYPEFLFLDADIATLIPLDRLFDAFSKSSAQFVYFDTSMGACYEPRLAAVMVPEYGSPAYNSGAFFSRRGVLSDAEIFAAADKATTVCEDFSIGGEQPFLNYVTDISRLRYADVSSLAPDLGVVIWARQPFTYDSSTDTAINADGKPMPFIHWAGCGHPLMVRPQIYLRHRTYGLSFPERIGYRARFYFTRYKISLLKAQSHWRKTWLPSLINRAKFFLAGNKPEK